MNRTLSASLFLIVFVSCGKSQQSPQFLNKKNEPLFSQRSIFQSKGRHCGKESHLSETNHKAFEKDGEYLIYNSFQLESLSKDESSFGLKFKLMNNLDLSNVEIMIGDSRNSFSGEFDGNFCEIKNLKIDRYSENAIALFPYTENAIIKNLNLSSFDLKGNVTGALSAFSTQDKFENILVADSEIYGENSAGALLGTSVATDLESVGVIDSSVKAGYFAGGLIGKMIAFFSDEKCLLKNYLVSNSQIQSDEIAGGVIGSSDSVSLYYGYAKAEVTGSEVGELIGEAYYSEIRSSLLIKENSKNFFGYIEEIKYSELYRISECSECVGLSSEVIFRGDLYNSQSKIYSNWPTVWLVTKDLGPVLTF